MGLEIRPYREEDLAGMLKVWNEVVENGEAFPQIEPLTLESAAEFFGAQTLSVVADLDGKVMGLYVLHPNNVGRCAHVGNASYAVASSVRGLGLGRALVEDSLAQAARKGFRRPAVQRRGGDNAVPSTCTRIWASPAWAPCRAASRTSWAAMRTSISTTATASTRAAPAEG